jgi:hypothetical protein
MDLIIVFIGLVAHTLSGNTWRAVMVEEVGHKAEMTVHKDDVVGAINGFTYRRVGDHYEIELESALTISNLPPGSPTKSSDFNDHVPNLAKALTVPLDTDAMNGVVSHSGVKASLQLGGGRISPSGCFTSRAVWSGADDMPPCLASEVRYYVTTLGDITVSDGSGSSITIRPTHEIQIKNVASGNHFFLYKKLAAAATTIRVPRRHNSRICASCKSSLLQITSRHLPLFPDLDCSNSQYP